MTETRPVKTAGADDVTRLRKRVAALEASAAELERLKEELRISEEKYRMAFEYTGTAMMVIEEDTTLALGNHKLLEVTGYPQETASSGRSWTEFVVEEDLPRLMEYHVARRESPDSVPSEYEFRMKHGSGDIRDIFMNVSMIPGTTQSLISLIDITERKQAEEAKLAEARAEADKARCLVEGLRKKIAESTRFHNMVSRSPKMRDLFEILPEVAGSSATVLVLGESGTGKELIARSLHELGARKDRPFIAINCSALPDNLLESELFGYRAGAFTDARADKPGKFALAEGGTIFLDEIGDISAAMQVKLLRVLQERVYEPLGGTEPIEADVRVVAATNRDLQQLVKHGDFREDLFYRINVLTLELPPLRERRCDIPLLADHFVDLFNTRYRKSIASVSDQALEVLLAHDYPGNIREMENVIEHAFIFCKGEAIEVDHLPAELRRESNTERLEATVSSVGSFKELEKLYIKGVLAESGGNKAETARRLGVHKTTLFRKLKQLGIREE
ncbi:MAG: sigma 54-interacting transcriptional regulator [Deltaproteobacteria bacterium]|nr:sigma 54-interacting transcriptional regulator [Deltaproteobacteria bacterium]